jgi:hypothetical protein
MGLTIFHLNVDVNSITKIYEENIFVSTKVQWLSILTSYIWVASRNLDLDDKVDADPKKKMLDMFEIHICENLDLQIWTPYAYSRGGTKFIDMLSFSH